jgi:hypothetical protein
VFGGPLCHRHGDRHRENGLFKRIPRQSDSHDTHDGDLRVFSKRRAAPRLATALSRGQGDTVHPKVVVTGNFANRDNCRKQPRGES